VTQNDRVQDGGEGGDAACWLSQVCTECGALLEAAVPMPCWRCGLIPERPQVDL